MKVTVRITKSFSSAAKPLLKKYHSLSNDLLSLEKELIATPRPGTSLGQDIYKIRLKFPAKGKVKVVEHGLYLLEATLVSVTEKISDEEITVYLITIYDKADVENISDKELKELIKNMKTK